MGAHLDDLAVAALGPADIGHVAAIDPEVAIANAVRPAAGYFNLWHSRQRDRSPFQLAKVDIVSIRVIWKRFVSGAIEPKPIQIELYRPPLAYARYARISLAALVN
jgi:hypothetical protein